MIAFLYQRSLIMEVRPECFRPPGRSTDDNAWWRLLFPLRNRRRQATVPNPHEPGHRRQSRAPLALGPGCAGPGGAVLRLVDAAGDGVAEAVQRLGEEPRHLRRV